MKHLMLCLIATIAGCQNLLAMSSIVDDKCANCQACDDLNKTINPDILYLPHQGETDRNQNKCYIFDLQDYKFFYGAMQSVNNNSFPEQDFKHIYVNSSNIEQYAFSGMKLLESVEINNDQPITIDKYAFYGCSNLKEIVIKGPLKHFSNEALNQTDEEICVIPSYNFKIFSEPNYETYNLATSLTTFPARIKWYYTNFKGNETSIDMFTLEQRRLISKKG